MSVLKLPTFLTKPVFRKCLFNSIFRSRKSLSPSTSLLRYCSAADTAQNAVDFKNDEEVMKIINQLHDDFDEKLLPFTAISPDNNVEQALPRNILQKYQSYTETDISTVNLQDIENAVLEPEEQQIDEFEGLNLERGKTGVFEVEDLVSVLQSENAIDVCVIKTPDDLNYVDYLVLASGRSWRHIIALAFFVRKLYKFKKYKEDPFIVMEGEFSHDWLAMDMGNIVLHLFKPETRHIFDLETLWTVGDDFKEEETPTLLEQHSYVLTSDQQKKKG